ncbi:MAG: hypothetical protein SGI74_12270 [Oligoflexia bacterium]|nr:hypothetical protein [Oligoflexia bacterium]
MVQTFKNLTLRLFFCIILLHTSFAQAATGKEFITSVIYGTLAGTLVGAATLAFTSNPGENMNAVARGSSYGLYAGILLGLYVTYGVDDIEEVEVEQGPSEGDPFDPNTPLPEGNDSNSPDSGSLLQQVYKGFAIYPIVPQNAQGSVGIGVNLIHMQF